MSRECKQARNIVMATFILVMTVIFLIMMSYNNKNISAHGHESDYYYELEQDKLLK